jgi:16S rRNA processing protein RimM
LVLGKIIKTKGLKGTVRVYSYAESLETFRHYPSFIVRGDKEPSRSYDVENVTPQKSTVLLKLKGVDDIDQAQALVGRSVCIPKCSLETLTKDEYYWHDLIGIEVWDRSNHYLGKIAAILRTGSNDVYVVRKDSEEVLVPGTVEVIEKVDVKTGIMVVDLPEVI